MGAVSLTNEAAANGQEFYANRLNNPSVPVYEKPLDFAGGLLSSLATESNLPKTAAVLGSAIFASQAIEAGAANGIGLLKAGVKPIHLIGGVLGGGTDLFTQLVKNRCDPSKIDPISIAGSTVSGILGAGLGLSVAKLGPIALYGLGRNIAGRTLLNGAGSAVIGGSVTLGQNAINRNIFGQSKGLFDGVAESIAISGFLGGSGSFLGDKLELGAKGIQSVIDSQITRQAYATASLEAKILNYSVTSYKVTKNYASALGTGFGNAIANLGPTKDLFKK